MQLADGVALLDRWLPVDAPLQLSCCQRFCILLPRRYNPSRTTVSDLVDWLNVLNVHVSLKQNIWYHTYGPLIETY